MDSSTQCTFSGDEDRCLPGTEPGALIHSLMEHDNRVLFPINPKNLARFREALYPSGAKDDPTDAHLLQLLLRLHRDKLKPVQSRRGIGSHIGFGRRGSP